MKGDDVAFLKNGEKIHEPGLRNEIIPQLTALQRAGHELIIVHGGGKQIAGLLREFNLDETAIEAAAFRKSADDLEGIDRLMASAEARRDKALVCIAQYRGDFGALLRESTDRLVEGKILKLEHAGSKERKSAA